MINSSKFTIENSEYGSFFISNFNENNLYYIE